MATNVELNWAGPLRFGESSFDRVPDRPAVYLWTLNVEGKHYVAYVGESSCVLSRWSEHLWWHMGGRYEIYNPAKLGQGVMDRPPLYQYTNPAHHLTNFTQEVARQAYENLRLYQVWYALLHDPAFIDRSWRMAVESSILNHLYSSHDDAARMIQNAHLSVSSRNAFKVCCTSRLPMGSEIVGLNDGPIPAFGECEPVLVPTKGPGR